MTINIPNIIELIRFITTAYTIKLGWCYYNFLLLRIVDESNIYAIKEIFLEGIYDIPLAYQDPLTIVDIGANIGDSVLFFSRKYSTAIIHAFEPNPKIFKLLKINILHNAPERRIYLYPLAVTQKKYYIPIPIYMQNDQSGSGTTCTKYVLDQSNLKKSYQTKSISFTQIINSIHKIDLLKIDIEGAEYELLPSLLRYANHIAYIILELHYNPTISCYKNIFKFMHQLCDYYDLFIYAPLSTLSSREDLLKDFFSKNFRDKYTFFLLCARSKSFDKKLNSPNK